MPQPAIHCRHRYETLHFLLTGKSPGGPVTADMGLAAFAVLILSNDTK